MIKITCISTVSSPSILEAAHKVRKDHGIDLDFRLYYPHQIEREDADEMQVITHLQASDCVLLDIRGIGKANELAMRAMRENNCICLNMMGPWSNLFEITRLGALSGKQVLDKAKAKKKASGASGAQETFPRPPQRDETTQGEPATREMVMETILAPAATPMSREDIANYLCCIDYWREGGLENYYQLLILLLRTYLGHPDPVSYTHLRAHET